MRRGGNHSSNAMRASSYDAPELDVDGSGPYQYTDPPFAGGGDAPLEARAQNRRLRHVHPEQGAFPSHLIFFERHASQVYEKRYKSGLYGKDYSESHS